MKEKSIGDFGFVMIVGGLLMRIKISKDDFVEWLKSKGLAKRSIQDYLYYFNKLNFNNITQKSIVQFINKYNANSIVKAFVRNVFHFIRTNDYSDEIKAHISLIEIPRRTGTRKKVIHDVITREQAHSIADSMAYERNRLMVLITFYGALRVGELLNIRPYDFDWDRWKEDNDDLGHLKVTGKGNKQRIVWITPEIMMRLYTWIQKTNAKKPKYKEDPLFNIKEKHWQRLLSNASRKSINKHIFPHLLRKSCATYLYDKGMDISEIKEYLGHEHIQTTMRYLQMNKEKIKKKIEAIYS